MMDPVLKTKITQILDSRQSEHRDPIVVDAQEYMLVLDYFQDFGHETGPNRVGNVPKLSWRGSRIDLEPA